MAMGNHHVKHTYINYNYMAMFNSKLFVHQAILSINKMAIFDDSQPWLEASFPFFGREIDRAPLVQEALPGTPRPDKIQQGIGMDHATADLSR